MRNVFFTADGHFGHGNIIKYCNRPFLSLSDQAHWLAKGGTWENDVERYRLSSESIKMMDDTIIDNINKTVGADDVLYHLGDFAFGDKHRYHQVCKEYRERINCKNIHMIWGNHDHPNQIHDLFSSNSQFKEININGQIITLCHYAMAIWNKSHHGAWQLYGHSHATAEGWLDSMMPNRKSIDVGVDNAFRLLGEFRPFSFEELVKIMGKKNGHSIDHHE